MPIVPCSRVDASVAAPCSGVALRLRLGGARSGGRARGGVARENAVLRPAIATLLESLDVRFVANGDDLLVSPEELLGFCERAGAAETRLSFVRASLVRHLALPVVVLAAVFVSPKLATILSQVIEIN